MSNEKETQERISFGDIVPTESEFDGYTHVAYDDIAGTPFLIEAVLKKQGDDGEYYVVAGEADGKKVEFSVGGKVVPERLDELLARAEEKGLRIDAHPSTEGGVTLKPEVSATFDKATSKGGRSYYVIR